MGDLSFILGAGQNHKGGTKIKRAGQGAGQGRIAPFAVVLHPRGGGQDSCPSLTKVCKRREH